MNPFERLTMRTCLGLWVAIAVLALAAQGCSKHEDTTAPPAPVDPGFDSLSEGVSLLQKPVDCPPGGDCLGFVQVLFNGQLRVNPLSDPAIVTAIDTLSASQLNEVRALALDSPMIEIFKRGNADCTASSDTVEVLSLLSESDDFSVKITGCTNGAAVDLRDFMLGLAQEYFPGQ